MKEMESFTYSLTGFKLISFHLLSKETHQIQVDFAAEVLLPHMIKGVPLKKLQSSNRLIENDSPQGFGLKS